MRLYSLRLSPFGHFDDLELAFKPGAVHLVYGPNEAGKSTCHAALVGHFFGWGKAKKDGPGVANLRGALSRVSAAWKPREGSELVEATRLTGQKIVDARGHDEPEGSYEARFAPFGRADFETFFALDHAALRDGATLLGDKSGGLRDALFAAARSGEDIGRVRAALVAEEEALFKPKARVLLVNKAVGAMKAASERARQLSSPPQKWEEEARGVESAAQICAALAEESARLAAELKRLETIHKLLECSTVLRETDDALDALPAAVLVDGDPSLLAVRIAQLAESSESARARITSSEAQIEFLSAELAEARAQAEFAAHLDAAREAQRAALDLARLARTAIARPATASVREPPREEHLQPLEEALQSLAQARAEATRLSEALREQRGELERLGAAAPVCAETASELRALERRAHESEAAAAGYAKQRALYTKSVHELDARTGLDDAHRVLVTLGLPTREEARELVLRWKEQEAEATRAEQELARALAQLTALAHELDSLGKQLQIPREEDLQRAREARDVLVTGKPQALALAAAIREADSIVDVMRRAADRVAERTAKEDELARVRTRAAQLREDAERLRARADTQAGELAARLREVPGPVRSAVELESWCALRERAQVLVVEERELLRAEAAGALLAAGLESPAAQYAERAERAEASERAVAIGNARRVELAAALARADLDYVRAGEQVRAAQHAVHAQAKALGREELDAALLAAWIRSAREERAEWEHETARAGEHARAAQTSAECKHLLRERLPRLGFTLSADDPPESLVAALDERIHATGKAEERAAALSRDLTVAQTAQHVACAERDAADSELAAILSRLELPDAARAVPVLQIESTRAELLARRAAERLLAARIAAVPDPEPLLAEAASTEREALERATADAKRRRAEVETALDQARRDEANRRAGLERMSHADHTASLALFEAEAARADAVALGSRWAVARLGVTLLHRALERYRQEHQDPVLAKASAAFAALTGGRYVRIVPELGDGKERLRLAVERQDGSVHVAAALSEGTRDQLYLAMRVGTLEARAEDGSLPLPIVLDDVFVNFDDARTEAGLARLAALVPLTDVVYFTHHEHVVELAQRALPAHLLDVVRLPAADSPAR